MHSTRTLVFVDLERNDNHIPRIDFDLPTAELFQEH